MESPYRRWLCNLGWHIAFSYAVSYPRACDESCTPHTKTAVQNWEGWYLRNIRLARRVSLSASVSIQCLSAELLRPIPPHMYSPGFKLSRFQYLTISARNSLCRTRDHSQLQRFLPSKLLHCPRAHAKNPIESNPKYRCKSGQHEDIKPPIAAVLKRYFYLVYNRTQIL